MAVIFAFIADFTWCTAPPVYSPSSYQRVAFLAEKPRHTSGPSLARHPTSLLDHFFIYLTEILHMEHGGHNKGGREEKQDDEKLGGR